MKTKYILKGLLATFIVIISFHSCSDDVDTLIEELEVEREFAPVGLNAIVRNQTTVELNWSLDNNVDNYVIEISEDESFATLVETINMTSDQLPFQVLLGAETFYYIRVKAVSSRGLGDSKWSNTTAQTLTEQIFLPIQPGDVLANEALLRWIPNSVVTQIVVTPGNITYDINPQEISDGIATITGLTGETEYTATLLNGSNIRGVLSFTTEVDPNTGTNITPLDDLFQRIADASPGEILLLEPGDYTSQIGTITLDKSITIRGLYSFDKPQLKVSIAIVNGAADVSLIDLDLTGDDITSLTDVVRYSAAGSYNSLLIKGCNIHDYGRSFIAGNVTSAIVNNVTVENCVVTNVLTNGGDFIDFRNSDALNVTVRTSTFNNCAPGRDFFRLDAAGDSNGTGITINVLLEFCTLYGVSNTADRILYVRFNSNALTVRNNIFAETTAYYSNQSTTDPNTIFENNNYFNAPGFFDAGQTLFDATTNYTTLDPEFFNAEGGDFTISNQTLKDNNIGDPRWR